MNTEKNELHFNTVYLERYCVHLKKRSTNYERLMI